MGSVEDLPRRREFWVIPKSSHAYLYQIEAQGGDSSREEEEIRADAEIRAIGPMGQGAEACPQPPAAERGKEGPSLHVQKPC